MRKVLLIEDDEKILYANKIILERRGGYHVQLAETLAKAQQIVSQTPPDIILLDIMLPDGSGLVFLRELRLSLDIPVLLLTALDTSGDVVNGLAAGGDDYLSKPYDNNVLLGRIDAVLRRTYKMPEQLSIGKITIDTASKRVYINEQDLGVNPKEFSLLVQFVQHPDREMSAEYLYEKIWGQKMCGDDRTLRQTISSLRTKLSDFDTGYTIASLRGEGYYFGRVRM